MLFAIGLMVTYEVVMRKIFNSPTIWVDEIARFFLVWAIYLASAHILKVRKLITVELFTAAFPEKSYRFFEFLALSMIGFFACIATYYGAEVVLESIEQGRRTSTMLGVPKWYTESAIPVGFGLLFIQVIVEYIKLLRGDKIGPVHGHDI